MQCVKRLQDLAAVACPDHACPGPHGAAALYFSYSNGARGVTIMVWLRASGRPSHTAIAHGLRRARRTPHAAALLISVAIVTLVALAVPFVALALTPGERLWLETYPPSGAAADHGRALALGSGRVYVTGTLGPTAGRSSDIVLLAYGLDGPRLWATAYDGPSHGADAATSVAVGRNGEIYVAGQATRRGSKDLVLLKFSSAGKLVWQRFCGSTTGPDNAAALALDRTGNVLVTGSLSTRTRGLDVVLAKYSPAGKRIWLRTWDGAAHHADKGAAIAVDRSGNAVIAGSTALARSSDTAALLLKYSASGQLRWAGRQSSGTHGDALSCVAVDAGGDVFAGGRARQPGTGFDALLIKYTAGGTGKWKWVVSGMQGGRDEIAAVCVDGGGWVHAAGSTVELGIHPNGLVMSCAASGSSRTLKTYDGGSYLADAFETIACDAARSVFVGGYATTSPGVTSAVVAEYTRDLSQRLWLTPYEGTADGGGNTAVSLAVAQSSVFVAGTVVDTVTGADLALARLQR